MTQSGEESTHKGEFGSYQMVFVLKGKVSFRKSISDEECGYIARQQHNLCCIPAEFVRMVKSNPLDEVICINLSNAFLNQYLSDYPAWKQFKAACTAGDSLMFSNPNMHLTPEIGALLYRFNQKSGNDVLDQLLLESKTIELLALQIAQSEQIRNASRPFSLKKDEMDKMEEARDILINTPGKPLSLRALAHQVGTNEFNLKRDFKIAFGCTVYNYLTQYKMEEARIMLENGDISIAEVASKMGYKYATHFSSAFKKYFGYLPSIIRSSKLSILLMLEHLAFTLESFSISL